LLETQQLEAAKICSYFFPPRCPLVRGVSSEVAINHGGLASIAEGQAKEFFVFSFEVFSFVALLVG
jgi:hypothetical protein